MLAPKLPPPLYIRTMADALKLRDRMWRGHGPADEWRRIAVDTEYSNDVNGGTDQGGSAELFYFQFTNGRQVVCVDGPGTSQAKGEDLDLIKPFEEIINSDEVLKLYSQMSADVTALESIGYRPGGFYFDTQVGDWMYDENRMHHGLKECAEDHCGIRMTPYKQVFGYFKPKKDGTPSKRWMVASMREVVWGSDKFPHIPWTGAEGRAKAEPYAALDPWATWWVSEFLIARLKEDGLWKLYCQADRPFGEVLRVMEPRGFAFDMDFLRALSKVSHAQIMRVQRVFREMVGKPDFKLGSGPQLQKLFWEELDMPKVLHPKTKKPTLEAKVMAQYAAAGCRPAELKRVYTALKTFKSNFADGLIDSSRDGIGYTVFKHTGTVTGRISTGDKKVRRRRSFQNIPSKPEKDPYKVRRAFRARPGKKLIVGDYSQVELYILAEESGDERMIQAFNRGEDLHMITASSIFNIPLPEEPSSWDKESADWKRWKAECKAWKEEHDGPRKSAKIVNFGLNYGMEAFKLHKDFNIPIEEAERWIETYFETYPGVRAWVRKTLSFCRQNGYVTTITGRRLHVPEINTRPADRSDEAWKLAKKIRGHAERRAQNGPIQGTAAELIKTAMIAIERDERLKELGNQMLLQVHDELVNEAPEETAEECMPIIFGHMRGAHKDHFKRVSIEVSGGIGDDWQSAKAA